LQKAPASSRRPGGSAAHEANSRAAGSSALDFVAGILHASWERRAGAEKKWREAIA
jgi:hypothetical protein